MVLETKRAISCGTPATSKTNRATTNIASVAIARRISPVNGFRVSSRASEDMAPPFEIAVDVKWYTAYFLFALNSEPAFHTG